jgi:hypothetical protein
MKEQIATKQITICSKKLFNVKERQTVSKASTKA